MSATFRTVIAVFFPTLVVMAGWTSGAEAQPDSAGTTSATASQRPWIPGGYDDKPYLQGVFGRILLGGYTEAVGAWERVDGVTEELGFEVARWNLFTSTRVSSAVTAWGELEIEEGGEEVRLELAQIDVRVKEWLQLRAGVLLVPLGRFNLAHDAPRNEFIDRPIEAVELLGVTLSQPGLGAFGRTTLARGADLSYELYAVNGFTDELLLGSPDGTRISAGRTNFEDNNASPAVAGRVAFGAGSATLGFSGQHGAYNTYRLDGVDVAPRRDVTIGVVDLEATLAGFRLAGEASVAQVEIPETLTGIFASRQSGFYADLSRRFLPGLIGGLPASSLTAAVRLEAVDFDRDLDGDSRMRFSAGLNLRPTDETVVKLGYARGRTRDRFNNASDDAVLSLGVATYF